jgi:Sulfotransferase domain
VGEQLLSLHAWTTMSGDVTNNSKLPTFLIVGAFKCGTTSLHHYLMQHPQIQMPPMKETNFFSGPPNGFPYATGAKRIKRLDEYEKLFDPAIRARGEASPNYTAHPLRPGTPARIKEVIPDAKLIYIVRDPVVRTVSHYHHRVSTEGERRSLQEALGDLSDLRSPYLSPSFYALQLDQYLQHFSRERIMVIDQADLLAKREATLREVFKFLSVDDSFVSPKFDEEVNTSEERRTYSKFIVLIRLAQASPLQRLPRGFRLSMRHAVERVISRPLEPPPLDDGLRLRLQELYADDVARLRKITGKAFSTWSI